MYSYVHMQISANTEYQLHIKRHDPEILPYQIETSSALQCSGSSLICYMAGHCMCMHFSVLALSYLISPFSLYAVYLNYCLAMYICMYVNVFLKALKCNHMYAYIIIRLANVTRFAKFLQLHTFTFLALIPDSIIFCECSIDLKLSPNIIILRILSLLYRFELLKRQLAYEWTSLIIIGCVQVE